MPTYTQNSNSWSSVARTGSAIAWAGISSALQSVDANWATWDNTATAPPYISEKLRASFPAFSIPTTEVITAINVYVRHKQPATPNPSGATCSFENVPVDIVNQNSFVSTTVALTPLSYTIANLNAGGVTYDLLYTVTCSFPLVGMDKTPYVSVDQVILEVITHTQVPVPPIGGLGIDTMTRIPELCR